MGQFSDSTKKWIRSIIKQRKLLIKHNASHLNQAIATLAIYRLETQLNAYPYDNDVYMGRFIKNFSKEIGDILPGKGSTYHEKRQREFSELRKQALLLEEKLTRSVNNCITNKKLCENEIAFN